MEIACRPPRNVNATPMLEKSPEGFPKTQTMPEGWQMEDLLRIKGYGNKNHNGNGHHQNADIQDSLK